MPDRLVTELTARRTLALRDAVAKSPHVALTTPLHRLVSDNFLRQPGRGCLEAQVMEVQVLHVRIGAGSTERGPDGTRVVGEDWTFRLSEMLGLRQHQGPGIEPGGGEERDPLVVAGLVPRVLAVTDQEHPAVYVEVAPLGPTYLIQPQRGGDGELDDARHRHRQACIFVKATKEAVQFSRRRAPVALHALADQTKTLQRNASEINAFE